MSIAIALSISAVRAQGPALPEITYLRFEEGSGSVTLDEAIPGVGAMPSVLTSNWASAPLIGASSIDSTAPMPAGVVPCRTNAAFTLTGSWTIEVELQRNASPTGTNDPGDLLRAQGTGVFFSALTLSVTSLIPSGVQFNVIDSVGFNHAIQIPNAAPLGVPSHVAVVHDSATSMLHAYHDGVLVNSVGTQAFGGFASTTNGLNVGAGGAVFTNNQFLGVVDEVRIWSRARSAAEIATFAHRDLFDLAIPLCRIDFQSPLPLIAFNSANGTYSASGNVASALLVGGITVNDPSVDPLITAPFSLSGSYGGSDLSTLGDILLTPATMSFTPAPGTDAITVTTQMTALPGLPIGFESPSSALPIRHRSLGQSSPVNVSRTGSGSELLDAMNTQMTTGSVMTMECALSPGGVRIKSLYIDSLPSAPITEARLRQLGAGGVQIGVVNVAPFSPIYNVFVLNPQTAVGTGPFFGLEFGAFQLQQLALPFPTPPFSAFANVEGFYSFNLANNIVAPGTIIDLVSISILPGAGVIGFASPVQRTVF